MLQLEHLRIEFEGRTGHSEQLEQQLVRFRQEVTESQETITRLRVELTETRERNQRAYQEELQTLQRKLALAESELETSRRELLRLNQLVASLRADLEAARKETEEARHKVPDTCIRCLCSHAEQLYSYFTGF